MAEPTLKEKLIMSRYAGSFVSIILMGVALYFYPTWKLSIVALLISLGCMAFETIYLTTTSPELLDTKDQETFVKDWASTRNISLKK